MNIQNICDSINKLIQQARTPLKKIPSILLLCTAIKRPGLSAMIIASKIIQKKAELGIPTGNAADGSLNLGNIVDYITSEQIVYAIKNDLKVMTTVPIGGISFYGTGANAGGPVTVTGINTNMPECNGIAG